MENNLIEKFFNRLKQVRLEKGRKSLMKSSLLLFVKNNPIKNRSVIIDWGNFFRPRTIKIASVLASILLVGGVVSAGANYSLPGDVLYPVKLGVNERVLSVLAFSDQAKASLSVQLVDLRLQEAEKLAANGNLGDAGQAKAVNNFKVQTNNLQRYIEKLNNNGMYQAAADAATHAEASLRAHKRAFEQLQKNVPNGDYSDFLAEVEDVASSVSSLRLDSENKVLNGNQNGNRRQNGAGD